MGVLALPFGDGLGGGHRIVADGFAQIGREIGDGKNRPAPSEWLMLTVSGPIFVITTSW